MTTGIGYDSSSDDYLNMQGVRRSSVIGSAFGDARRFEDLLRELELKVAMLVNRARVDDAPEIALQSMKLAADTYDMIASTRARLANAGLR